MKRTLSLLMALVLMLALIAIPASAETTTVKFWTHQNPAWNASYERIIEAFHAEFPDIKIEYTNFPYNDFEAKIQTGLIAGETGADIYEVWGGWMLDFVDAGALAEAPESLVAELKEDAFAPVLGTLVKDGKFYGAPLELNVEYGGIVVNKKLFGELGLEYPTTWQGVIDTAKQVSKSDGDLFELRGLEFACRDNLCANFLSLIRQKGGQYLVDGKVDFNTVEANEAMQQLADYITVDKLTNLDSTTEAQGVSGHQILCVDEALMVTRGPWVLSDCVESFGLELGTDVDYIKQPAFIEGGDQAWVAETGWSLCVPKNTKVADAAWTFIEYVMRPEVLKEHNVACAQVPPRASVASDPTYVEAMPSMEPLLDILTKAEFIGPFNTDQFKEYLCQAFINIVNGDVDVKAGLEKLTSDLQANMKMY